MLYVIMEAKFWVKLQSVTAWKLMDIWQENEKKASRERTVQQVEIMQIVRVQAINDRDDTEVGEGAITAACILRG